MAENRGIKIDLKFAMDTAEDILKSGESLEKLAKTVTSEYDTMFSGLSDNVRKVINQIEKDTKGLDKSLGQINFGKKVFEVDPQQTLRSLQAAQKVVISQLESSETYIRDHKLSLAEQLGLDQDSDEFREVLRESEKAHTEYFQRLGKSIKREYDKLKKEFVGEGQGRGSTRGIGMYFLSSLIGSSLTQLGNAYTNAPIGVHAGEYSREQTSFDIKSAPGMYQMRRQVEIQNMIAEAELKALQTKTAYTTGGKGIGGVLGGVAGNFLFPGLGTVTGAYIGSEFGGAIGNILGTNVSEEDKAKVIKEAADKQRKTQTNLQIYSLMEQYAGAFTNYDIAKNLFGARYGKQKSVGGDGLGYSMTELSNLAYQQASITGSFNKKTFDDQLSFSRAYGYAPEEIIKSSFASRYTGERVGGAELMARQNLANQTGMAGRAAELINSMNQLAVIMTQLSGATNENKLMKFSALPAALFGNDSPYGRLSDLGMSTLNTMNSGMMPEMGSVQSIELLRSYQHGANKRGDKTNLFDLVERTQQGIYGEHNIEDLLGTALEKSGGNTGMFKAYMHAMTGLNYKQAGMISEQLDATGGKTDSEKIERWSENWQTNVDKLEESGEKSAGHLEEIAKNYVPKSLDYLAKISDASVKMGESTFGKVYDTTLEVIKVHAEIMKDSVKLAGVTEDLLSYFKDYFAPKNQTLEEKFTKEYGIHYKPVSEDMIKQGEGWAKEGTKITIDLSPEAKKFFRITTAVDETRVNPIQVK
jgi:uncharacterized protein YcfJ